MIDPTKSKIVRSALKAAIKRENEMRFIIVETSDTLFEFDDIGKALEWIGTLCKNRVRFTVKHSNGVKLKPE